LLASSLDDTLRLFDRSSGTLLSTYTGHINHDYVMRCAFMHKDAYVISGSEDGSLLIWDLLQNAPLQRLEAHTKYVPSICIHPREPTHLISASFDGTLAFWS
jgi:mitogen-activated protein kinase organizer 1